MTISNLLLLVLVLVFSTESMADTFCPKNIYDMLWDQCPLYSHEGWASWWKPGVRPPPRAHSYTRLLVLQWPPTFCNIHRIPCDHIYTKFTVHGLWFNIDSKTVCCHNQNAGIPFQRMGRDLRDRMISQWPNLNCPKDPVSFWLYEYSKHGSCVPKFQQNQVLYFRTALNILGEIGEVMTMRLPKSGRSLIGGQFYNVTEFEYVTIGGRAFFPSLRCVGRPYFELLEIVFCTNKFEEQIRCPLNVQNCYSNILYKFPSVPASLSSSSRSPP